MDNKNKQNELEIIYSKIYTEEANLENKYKKEAKSSDRVITIRVTEEEFNDITRKAEAAGMSKKELLVQSTKDADIKVVDPKVITEIVEVDEKINQLICNEKQEIRKEFNAIKDEVFDGMIGGR